MAKSEQALWASANVAYWPNGVVPICFRNMFSSRVAHAEAVRAIVEAEFEALPDAEIDFTGWEPCPETVPFGTMRFVFNSGVGGNSSVGYDPANAHTFAGVDRSLGLAWNTLVLHELTHVLGFHHEFDRADSPVHIEGEDQHCVEGPREDVDPNERDLTVYDPDSIANQTYCVRASTGRLSPLDRLGLEIAYASRFVHPVRARYGLMHGSSIVVREDDVLVNDWSYRGATEAAFALNPLAPIAEFYWSDGDDDIHVGVEMPAELAVNVDDLTATYFDFRGRQHELDLSDTIVSSSYHTALLLTGVGFL